MKPCKAAGVSDTVTSKAAESVKAQHRPLAANVAPLGCGTMQWLKRAAQCRRRPDSCDCNVGNTSSIVPSPKHWQYIGRCLADSCSCTGDQARTGPMRASYRVESLSHQFLPRAPHVADCLSPPPPPLLSKGELPGWHCHCQSQQQMQL